jgi:hypothetical protein
MVCRHIIGQPVTPLCGKGANVSEAMGVEYWILEREGRMPAPAPATATDGGGWIACSERMPEVGQQVQVIHERKYTGGNWWTNFGVATHWRPFPVDPHTVAACLFSDRYRPTLEQARAAARHVAGCVECQAKLEEKGGA